MLPDLEWGIMSRMRRNGWRGSGGDEWRGVRHGAGEERWVARSPCKLQRSDQCRISLSAWAASSKIFLTSSFISGVAVGV